MPVLTDVKELTRTIAITLRNILLGGNLISLSVLHKPRQMALYVTENLFYYKSFFNKRGIPQKQIFDVFPVSNVEEIKLANLDSKDTWFHKKFPSRVNDIVSLCLLCRAIKPRVVFEIGTLRGYTAYHFALNSPPDATVYTLDLPKEKKELHLDKTMLDEGMRKSYFAANSYCFENSEVTSKITCLFGDSATFDYSDFEKKVDLFFIDGAHSYEYVRNDTLKALECCHSGSVIAWHDFGKMGVNGVSKWVLELSRNYEIYSIAGGTLAFMIVPEM